ncbi:MAG TPA: hypothetical protein VGC27_03815 [Rhizomicrobium sp.]
MIRSGESAPSLDPAQAAGEAVKAYVRMNRERLAADGELLALLLPERFASAEVRDLQRFAIERLTAENRALKIECDALKGSQDRSARLGDGVRRAVLDLIEAASFGEVVAVATSAASVFGADKAVLCVEGADGIAASGWEGVRLIGPGTVTAVLGPGGSGAILSGGGELLFGPGGGAYKSLAAFRLRLGGGALYVLGAEAEGCFEGREIEADLGYFARGLERAIRAKLIEKCPYPPKA